MAVPYTLVRGGCFGRGKDVSSHPRFVELIMSARMIAETANNMRRLLLHARIDWGHRLKPSCGLFQEIILVTLLMLYISFHIRSDYSIQAVSGVI